MATVFVTGATGVIGRATIPQLLASGYTVRALSRGEANDSAIRALGAEPVRADLFDPDSLCPRGRWRGCHPPSRHADSAQLRYATPLRLGRERSHSRSKARRTSSMRPSRAGAGVFVYPSFAFVYPDSGDAWIDAGIDSRRSDRHPALDHRRRARGGALRGRRPARSLAAARWALRERSPLDQGAAPARPARDLDVRQPSPTRSPRRSGSATPPRLSSPRSTALRPGFMTSSTTSRSGNGSSRPRSPRPPGGAECSHSHSGSYG